MSLPDEYSFVRYLSAKKTVDDRALNRPVWELFKGKLADLTPDYPLRLLEIGAGVGTMIERILDEGMLIHAEYTALDSDRSNIAAARTRLMSWVKAHAREASLAPGEVVAIRGESLDVEIHLSQADVFEFIEQRPDRWDVLIANAFLDLVDIPTALPKLFQLLNPGGVFYFSVNFDGLTHFEPAIDPVFDALIEQLYHRTMDERQIAGQPSGDSCAGRHLFGHIRKSGGHLISAGASDWVVFPGENGYMHDEAYFLHFIIDTLYHALKDRPELDAVRFNEWIARRHAQVRDRELVYITHQLDFLGLVGG